MKDRACIMFKLDKIQTNPWYFMIIVIHIAVINKLCFVLGSFPFNIYFQYIVALLFATDFVLMLPATNFFKYDDNRDAMDYFQFIVFIMCCLLLLLLSFRPISILCEGKYPKFVAPIYRDYYDSEDGGWRADEYSQHEETAISNYKSQLLRIPATNTLRSDIASLVSSITYIHFYIDAIMRTIKLCTTRSSCR